MELHISLRKTIQKISRKKNARFYTSKESYTLKVKEKHFKHFKHLNDEKLKKELYQM